MSPADLARPLTRWDNVGLAVDRSVDGFVAAAHRVNAVRRVDAKSSGPHVHFLVTVAEPWDAAIDRLEIELHPLVKAGGVLFDYDVHTEGEPEPDRLGYVQVYSVA